MLRNQNSEIEKDIKQNYIIETTHSDPQMCLDSLIL